MFTSKWMQNYNKLCTDIILNAELSKENFWFASLVYLKITNYNSIGWPAKKI